MERKRPHLTSPIDYKAVNGVGMWKLIRMLMMGRAKSGGLCPVRSASHSTPKEGGYGKDKTKKGVAHNGCRMIKAHKAKDKCNEFADFFTK
jgi:hypothetical protein